MSTAHLPSDRGGYTPSITPAPSLTGAPKPQRHQRSRKRGYRTPPGVIYVGRPTVYGNPFDARRFGHARSVLLYRRWIACELGALQLEALGFCPSEIDGLTRWRARLETRLPQLAGRDLQCWCPATSRWCHADALLSVANGGRA
ncbi:MAG: DUF4326 domain-containing protein [Sphingobium sp.]|nr:DUF4326 domain-containing protein [Sphingobium sp.]MBP6112927.1 DUF4326 domain-containing protein [Sphingobium sp.]MBP8670226.1 DUF4326 domain-containing protein [Sphingobium sp.]MBP9157260.1 DUF4326 domain-containing protein [Sphingobium sp.]